MKILSLQPVNAALIFMTSRKLLNYIAALAAFGAVASAAMILYYILRYGVDVPYMDQWEFVGFFDHLAQGQLTFEELFRQGNEYRQFFPNLIFVSLGWLTHWNVRYEMLVIFLLACLTAFNVYRLSRFTLPSQPWLRWLLMLLACLFIFSPMQWENWLFGVQIEYMIPAACISTGLVISFANIKAQWKLLWCLLLAVVSTYSCINGFLIWVVLYPALFFSGRKNEFFRDWLVALVWFTAMCVALFFYFNGYQKPGNEPGMNEALMHPADGLLYLMGTLGNTLRVVHILQVIMLVGGLLLLIFVAEILYVLWHARDKALLRDAVVWIVPGLYSLMTAGMLMVGRLGYGAYQSLASRYTSYTLYVAVAAIFLAAIILRHRARGRRLPWWQQAMAGLMIAFVIFTKMNTYPVAVAELKAYHARMQHGKAALLFINYISHQDCENQLYPRDFDELRRKANILDSYHLLRPALLKSNILQYIEGEGSGKDYYGNFDVMADMQNHVFLATGSARLPRTGGPADAVLLSFDDAQGRAVLLALSNDDKQRWVKMVWVGQLPSGPLLIRAWAFDADEGKAYRLKGSHRVRL
ncbi:MAG: hypothetical protein WCL06_03420 [Bacteroidota bacterium]